VLASICGSGRLRALHVNYGLRAEESDGDERHVRELCERLGVAATVIAAPPAPARGNLQAGRVTCATHTRSSSPAQAR